MKKSVLLINSYNIGNTILKTPLMQALNAEGFVVDIVTDNRLVLGGDIDKLLEGQPYLRNVYSVGNYTAEFPFAGIKYDLIIVTIPNDTPFTNGVLNVIRDKNTKIIIGDKPSHYDVHESVANILLAPEYIGANSNYKCYLAKLNSWRTPEWFTPMANRKYCVFANTAKNEGRWYRKRISTKIWYYLITEIQQKYPDIHIIFIGGKGDTDAQDTIMSNIGCMGKVRQSFVHNIVGQTSLTETAAIISGAEFFIGSDSGPMHIAASLGTPTVGLFTFTKPAKNAPFGPASDYVQTDLTACPCQYGGDNCVHPICSEHINIDEVLSKLGELYIETH